MKLGKSNDKSIYIFASLRMYVGEWVSDILSHMFDRERGGRMELYSDMGGGAGGGRQTLTRLCTK